MVTVGYPASPSNVLPPQVGRERSDYCEASKPMIKLLDEPIAPLVINQNTIVKIGP